MVLYGTKNTIICTARLTRNVLNTISEDVIEYKSQLNAEREEQEKRNDGWYMTEQERLEFIEQGIRDGKIKRI